MITICWAAKGGSGTTVYAVARALATPLPTLLVDLDGDVMTVLGLPSDGSLGVHDWLRSDASAERLTRLEHRATERLCVVPAGNRNQGDVSSQRWAELGALLRRDRRQIVVDVGTRRPPTALLEVADERLLVTRQCYLGLRHAADDGVTPSGVVLVEEPGRSFKVADIEASLGAAVVARVLLDPAIARAVDSGLLISRLPNGLRRRLVRQTSAA